MDIGQVDSAEITKKICEDTLNAMLKGKAKGKGKSKGDDGKGSWQAGWYGGYGQWKGAQGYGQANSWGKGDPHKGGDGKGGRTEFKGKGKGKGNDKQCYRCWGYGHIAANCPSKGLQEVGWEQDASQEPENPEGEQREDAPFPVLGAVMADGDDNGDQGPPGLGTWSTPRPKSAVRCRSVTRSFAKSFCGNSCCSGFSVLQEEEDDDEGLPEMMGSDVAEEKENWGWHNFTGFLTDDTDMEADGEAEMLNTVSDGNVKWERITAVVDSGAVENVLPEDCIPSIPVKPSAGSKAGKTYRSATGEPIPNKGEKSLITKTNEGQWRSITFQVAPVKKALISVSRMVAHGNEVLLDKDPRIINKATKQVTKLRSVGSTYLLDLWVQVPCAPAVFRRQR